MDSVILYLIVIIAAGLLFMMFVVVKADIEKLQSDTKRLDALEKLCKMHSKALKEMK